MTVIGERDLYYDPYDVDINGDPYAVFRRLREEAPLYYNATHDFYAASRYEDVERGLKDRETFSSARGAVLELIKSGMEIPPGTVIFEDPPTHTIHRSLLSRMFTPRKVAALEPQIRKFCADALDPLVGSERFDLIAQFGAQMPMRVIGMLLGIPEQDQEAIRDRSDDNLRTEPGQPMKNVDALSSGDSFEEYLDWRAEHPSDDIMTELLNAEFDDETGVRRRLTRRRAGDVSRRGGGRRQRDDDTADRLDGQGPGRASRSATRDRRGPDARQRCDRGDPAVRATRAACRSLRRRATPRSRDKPCPEGSAILFLVGAANRDDRRFPNGDTFDIHRKSVSHLTFGYGAHFCLGAALARLEGRIALDELLNRFPEWDVDLANAKIAPTSTVRGWETLPIVVG